jgi:hypothetical protein
VQERGYLSGYPSLVVSGQETQGEALRGFVAPSGVGRSAYRQRWVHLAQHLVDQHFSIVIGDALDGFVYHQAAPQQVSDSLIRLQPFSFFVPWRVGIVVGHGEVLPSEPRFALWPLARAQNNLPAFSGKQSSLLSLMRKVKREPQARPMLDSGYLYRELREELSRHRRFDEENPPEVIANCVPAADAAEVEDELARDSVWRNELAEILRNKSRSRGMH